MTDKKTKLIRAIFFIYIAGVLFFTFVVRESMILRSYNNRGAVLTPLREYFYFLNGPNRSFWFRQISLNILMLIPWGILIPAMTKHMRNFLKTVLAGMLFSCLIEAMQYITGRGLTEIDDVINNTLGAAAGYGLYSLGAYIYRRKK